jgi:NAD-dependent deacetylase
MHIQKLQSLISQSSNIVFFGGAGVSTESNIPDFRSEDGIFQTKKKYGYSPEYILSHDFFVEHTEEFYDYYKNQLIYKDAKPNQAHLALAQLEEQGKLKAVITQNIDGLHQQAGSREVLELHGSVHRNYCIDCKKTYGLQYIIDSRRVPKCSECNGLVRPDVVLYNEVLDEEVLNKAVNYIYNADMLIIGGTSLAVYPAAGLIEYYRGNKLVLINKSSTPYDSRADLIIHDSIGKVFSEVMSPIA